MEDSKDVISSLPIKSTYADFELIWDKIDDCLAGEDVIKMRKEVYLRKTEGMRMDKIRGDIAYEDYLHRATWFDFPIEFYNSLFGILWQKDPIIEVPDDLKMNYLPNPSYLKSKSFLDIYRNTSSYLTKYGRHAILLDPPDTTYNRLDMYPNMIQYDTRQIVNWGYTLFKGKQVLKFVLLDESFVDYENEALSPVTRYRYRFLGLKTHDENGNELPEAYYYSYTGNKQFKAIFDPPFSDSGIVEYDDFTIIYPRIHNKFKNEIPFYCFNGYELSLEPSKPIIYPLCNASLSLYKASADYEISIHKQSFGVLFGKGLEQTDLYTGTQKAVIVQNPDADLKWVEIGGSGLSEQRTAVENKIEYARSLGLSLVKSGDETGESVKNNISLKTASLKSIAKTLADGFTVILKSAADWRGLSEKDVTGIDIIPNLEFSILKSSTVSMNNFSIWSSAIKGYTNRDYYNKQRENGDTSYASYEEWEKIMNKEQEERDKIVQRTKQETIISNENQSGKYSSQSLSAEEGGDHINDATQVVPDGKSRERTNKKK